MSWGSRTIAGVTYDLTHLDGFAMGVTPKRAGAPTYNVRVEFGAHTFTRDLLDTDTPDYHFWDGNTLRCFCTYRHGNSLFLPDLIKAASGGKAYFGNKDRRYLIIENVEGLNAPYAVVFKLDNEAANQTYDARMFVVSAHERPGLPPRIPRIGLGTLVDLTVQGKPIVRPKK